MKLRNCPCCPRSDLSLQNLICSFHCQDSTTASSHRSPPKSKEDHVQTQFPQLVASCEAPSRLPIRRRQSVHHLPGLSNGEDEKQLQESSNGDPAAAYSSRSGEELVKERITNRTELV
ncbi:hypothetical protein EV1_046784 [Malus domestica]